MISISQVCIPSVNYAKRSVLQCQDICRLARSKCTFAKGRLLPSARFDQQFLLNSFQTSADNGRIRVVDNTHVVKGLSEL